MSKIEALIKQLKIKNTKKYGHDFLQTWDKSKQELEATILTAEILYAFWKQNISPRVFDSGLAVSWFRDKSTRTRFSFKSAADLLGLSVQDLDEQKSQISHGETTRETANMISFMTEVIGIRDDKYLDEGHKFQKQVSHALTEGYNDKILTQRPGLINLQCDRDHPTQSMADITHLKTYFKGLENLKGKKIAITWAYSPSYGKPMSVAQGTIGLLTRFGMHVNLAYPKGYHLIPELEKQAAKFAKKSDGSFEVSNSMEQAFKDADIVYPKSWASYQAMERRADLYRKNDQSGIEVLEKDELKENAQYKDWECTEAKMKLTKKGQGLYMHCLPADVTGQSCKQGEVTSSVFDKHRIQTFREAGYKPLIITAMMFLTKYHQHNPAQILEKLYKANKPIRV
ncbi:MAG: knotted carbamoyltransferase YgeW [Patescibacteria group bacterium]|nr:knotted carbamoyltransferase YgeW [Patescibacteria group bacterium]